MALIPIEVPVESLVESPVESPVRCPVDAELLEDVVFELSPKINGARIDRPKPRRLEAEDPTPSAVAPA
jgi:hypothetical protein